ncbi:MAG: 2-phosphosulfolactate phosphatase [Chitinophagaceae bacterium]
MLPTIETCFSPSLLHLYDLKGKIVIIIDVFRATSTIATALHQGAKAVIPVASVEECIALGNEIPNSITAGERNGMVVEGLQHGNSPLSYPNSFIQDKTLILTTTNGTRLLHQCLAADEILTGSFLNLDAICSYIVSQKKDVLLACASWKDRYNLEDSLFAGAVYEQVQQHFAMNCDSTRAALHLYKAAKTNLYAFIQDSSHFIRLSKHGLEYDMEYCCMLNKHNVVVKLNGRELLIAK